ncbi:hypothetical protein EV210_101158 [Anaerospora hongkongensis]|uniref:Uncharacterized protein n=1 Tax=Anaerospora hongkongensis TaxID=244830 RepID=A0A4R1Q1Z2_9FIRM|nr:hypothetical protein [Anaerospora hongkongensis]TCL39960.1 hypothetical protein EV210_101158 [Anaerospora hongkongensis]
MVTLNPEEEQAFRKWYGDTINGIAIKTGFQLDPNPDSPDHHYDYRGFYKAQQAGDPAAQTSVQSDGLVHFTSPWKLPDHPTYKYKTLLDLFIQSKYDPAASDNEVQEVSKHSIVNPELVQEYLRSNNRKGGGG